MLANRRSFIRRHSEKSRIYKHAFDGFAIGFGFWLAMMPDGIQWEDRFLWVYILAYALFMLLAEYNEVYICEHSVSPLKKVPLVIFCWVGAILLLLLSESLLQVYTNISYRILIFWCFATAVQFAGWRFVFYLFLKVLGHFRIVNRNVAIAGGTPLAVKLAKTIMNGRWRGERLLGFYDDRHEDKQRVTIPKNVESLGNFDDMVSDARSQKLNVIYLVLPLKAENRMFEQIKRLADTAVSVYIVPDFSPYNLLNSRLMTVNGISLVSIFESPFIQYYSFEDFLKRTLDIVVSIGLIVIFIIPMIIIAVGIKLSSKGPAIFQQARYGIDGNKIVILKFRTMTVCETGEESVQATKNDPRVTGFGRYLRKYSLDELPQLFNILAGAMSLVGPRPHSVALNECYRTRIHGYMLRHKMKPGLTGWAQVCGLRGETDTLDKMEKRVQHDLEYMEKWTLALDLKIMIMTVFRRAWVE